MMKALTAAVFFVPAMAFSRSDKSGKADATATGATSAVGARSESVPDDLGVDGTHRRTHHRLA
jgi:hypothetical protein